MTTINTRILVQKVFLNWKNKYLGLRRPRGQEYEVNKQIRLHELEQACIKLHSQCPKKNFQLQGYIFVLNYNLKNYRV